MNEVVMLLSNAFKPDPRVLKEAEILQQNGFNLTILCWDRQAELVAEDILPSGVKIIRIQNIPSTYGIGIRQLWRIPKFWMAVQRHLKQIRPCIVHCHDFDTLPAGLWFGKTHRLPVIYDAHEYYAELVKPRLTGIIGWLVFSLIKLCEQIGVRFSNAVVTVDQTLAAIYQKYNHNVLILGHFPEIKMALQSNPVFVRSDLTLIYAGRLSTDRGILLYADMVRKLQEKGIPAQLLLAGVFTPESERAAFYVYAKDISNSVKYLGWISYDQISEIYHSADIGLAVLLPESRYVAATPVKLFEYMASGLPVIASNFPSIAEIVNDASCGLLIDPLGGLAEAINSIELWWQSKVIPQTLGENGRRAILSKYNWENYSNCLVELYQELI
jgi:glycosyltransferase involved in cell wall biosynthesis